MPPAPVLDRHIKTVYRHLLSMIVLGDSPNSILLLEAEFEETFNAAMFNIPLFLSHTELHKIMK